MSYSAPNRLLLAARHSIDTMSDAWQQASFSYASVAWPSANLAIYQPVRIPSRVVVVKLWVGSNTTGTGNVDMALYDASGVAVVTATNAAKSTSSDEQVFDVTDTVVGPGLYYIGVSSDSGTDTFWMMGPPAPILLSWGVLSEAAAYPLPATATWTANQTLARAPLAGLLLEATVA